MSEVEESITDGCVFLVVTVIKLISALDTSLVTNTMTVEERSVDVDTLPILCSETEDMETDGSVVLNLNHNTTLLDVGIPDILLLFTPTEDGTVSESTEVDTDLQLVSVTEFMVLTLLLLEVKVTTVDVETPKLSSPRETLDGTVGTQLIGTVKLQLLLTTSKDVGI